MVDGETLGVIYLLKDLPEEVYLISKAFQFGLQLNLIHVGLINILQKTIIIII